MDGYIDIVENAYKTHGLPAVFTMHEFFEPKNLKDTLLKRGYQTYDHTIALGIEIDDIQPTTITNDFEYFIFNSRVKEISEFLARFSKRNESEQNTIQEINQRILIPKKCYVITKYQNEVMGTLFAALVPQGYLYIGDVFVHPDFRRQGVAKLMLIKLISEWAKPNGVKKIWLQVEKVNTKALDLYYKLGMKKLYGYYYMKGE
ncbi:MAG: GNAT family N-acetyltransferase [Promethearchaeota archaeon]|jgi:RimJ/RimL family protein N-acetyltransferase